MKEGGGGSSVTLINLFRGRSKQAQLTNCRSLGNASSTFEGSKF